MRAKFRRDHHFILSAIVHLMWFGLKIAGRAPSRLLRPMHGLVVRLRRSICTLSERQAKCCSVALGGFSSLLLGTRCPSTKDNKRLVSDLLSVERCNNIVIRCGLGSLEVRLGPEDVGVAYTLHSLGVCVREVGRLNEAEESLSRCLRIQETRLGQEDAQVACTLLSLGMCLRKGGRLEEAEELFKRCVDP